MTITYRKVKLMLKYLQFDKTFYVISVIKSFFPFPDT